MQQPYFHLCVWGKFNIEVQSVDRCNLNNLYLKTPRDQGTRPPINDFAWQKKLAMHKKKKMNIRNHPN